MTSIIQKVRTSFTTQLTLWVASLVTVISVVVVGLLAIFSQDVIFDETMDTTLQAMETTALRIDNTLRQNEMSARLEGGQVRVNRAAIDRLIEENGCLSKLRQTLPNAELYVTRRDSTQLGIFIAGEQSGYRRMEHDGREMFIFTQPVGVVILLIVLYFIVGRHLRPLHWLADSAQSIAEGNLDTPIPDAHHEHEAGRLQNSLAKMQQALKAYMTEMQQKQVTLSKQNAELKAAYAEVQAYEVKKTNFVHDMTAQMAQPVERLCQEAETICRDAATMTREEMAQRQAVVMQDSETITQLLDKLMKETAL